MQNTLFCTINVKIIFFISSFNNFYALPPLFYTILESTHNVSICFVWANISNGFTPIIL